MHTVTPTIDRADDRADDRASAGVAVAAWGCAILLPVLFPLLGVVGITLGGVLAAKGRLVNGVMVMVTAVIVSFLSFVAWVGYLTL